MFPALRYVSAARNRDGMVLRFTEEVAKANAENAADSFKRVKGGNHAVRFELGKQGGGALGLRC